jgi:hypothetical protein
MDPGTIPAYVCRADTSADEHKRTPYVRRLPDEYKLRTLVFKPMNVI